MNNRLEIQIGNKKLVAIVNDWSDELPNELCIFLEDKNGAIMQDICVVREHYHFNAKAGKFDIDNNFVDCLVWENSDYDDYSHQYCIGVREDEDD